MPPLPTHEARSPPEPTLVDSITVGTSEPSGVIVPVFSAPDDGMATGCVASAVKNIQGFFWGEGVLINQFTKIHFKRTA